MTATVLDPDALDSSTQAPIGGLLATLAVVYFLAVGYALVRYDYDTWGGFIVGTLLAVLSWSLLIRFTRRDPDPLATRFLLLAFTLKQIGTLVRHWVIMVHTGGDALEYHKAGKAIAPYIRAQDFGAPEFVEWVPDVKGTAVIRIITGVIYNLFGTSRMTGFAVFGFLGFWGVYFIYRAYRMSFPEGRHRRFMLLIFCSPTLLFWPSSIGKDAWMIFTIGIAVYGAVRVYLLAPGGFVLIALGLAGSAIVRVHVTVILLAGIIVGGLLGRMSRHAKGKFRGFVRVVLTLVFLAGAVGFTASRAQDFFGEVGGGSLTGTLDETERRSTQGGSSFTPARVTSPTGLPQAIVTVLFRPFPNEAHNFAARLTALEGLALLLLTAVSIRRVVELPKLARQHPLVGLVFMYSGLFIVAFSTLGNFGILARQRSQLYPLFFVLLALPKREKKVKRPEPLDEPPVPLDGPLWESREREREVVR